MENFFVLAPSPSSRTYLVRCGGSVAAALKFSHSLTPLLSFCAAIVLLTSSLFSAPAAYADFKARDAAMISVAVVDLGLIAALIWSATHHSANEPKAATQPEQTAVTPNLVSNPGYVPYDDPRLPLYEKYRDLQPQQQHALHGLRPYTFTQLADDTALANSEANWFVEEMRQRLQKSITPTFSFGADQQFSFDLSMHAGYQFTDSASTAVLTAQAISNPFLDGTEGRFYQDGNNAWLEPRLALGWRPSNDFGFGFVGTPTLTLSSEETTYQDDVDTDWRYAYMLLRMRSLLLEVGRDSLGWGVGRLGNLLFSGNNKPFNYIARLRNDVPVEMPWLFHWMGPTMLEAFYAQLDDNLQTFPDGHLVGSKVSFSPWRDLELGFGYTVQFGGQGAPSNDPLLILGDALTDVTAGTNRNFIFECRYRWRDLNIEPYAELLVEDCCDEIPINPRDVMNLFGIYLPNIDGLGKLDMTLEWVRTNQISYRHGTFDSGYVYRNRILGHSVGPDATAVTAQLRYWFNDSFWLTTLGAIETRGRRGLTIGDQPIVLAVPYYQVPESRYRWTLQGDLRLGDYLGMRQGSNWLRFEGGYEWAEGFNFIADNGEAHILAGLSLHTLF